MSDFNSSLPVRTQSNGDVVAFIADGTTSSQLMGVDSAGRITIKLDDGAGNAVTSQANGGQRALDVGINVAGVQIDPRSIRALTSADVVSVVQSTSPWITKDQSDGPVTPGTVASFSQLAGGQYNSTLPTLTTGQQAALQVDASGRLIVDLGTALPAGANTIGAVTQASGPWTQNLTQVAGSAIALGQTTMSASLPVTIASNQTALPVSQSGSWTVAVTQSTSPWVTSDLADGSVSGGTAGTKSMLGGGVYNSAAPTLTNGQQASLQLDASGNLDVNLKTALPAGANLIGSVNLDIGSAAVSATNPVPVYITSSVPGTLVNNYQTSVNVAAGASVNFVYTIPTGKTFSAYKFWMSASGKIRADVQTSPDGSTYSTYWTSFNSTANPNITIDLNTPAEIQDSGVGSTIRVVITNKDLQAFDVFSTITGTYQ